MLVRSSSAREERVSGAGHHHQHAHARVSRLLQCQVSSAWQFDATVPSRLPAFGSTPKDHMLVQAVSVVRSPVSANRTGGVRCPHVHSRRANSPDDIRRTVDT